MMRKYVFLSQNITDMGGAQIYERNKSVYLANEGWDVAVFSFQTGKVYIEELKQYEPFILKELRFPPYFYTSHKQKEIINKLMSFICDEKYDEYFIESNSIKISLWGELISNELGCKNLIYTLDETNYICNSLMFDYLYFKYRRRELAGIVRKSIFDSFAPFIKISMDDSYFLSANPTGGILNVSDCAYSLSNENCLADFTIGCIGRLDKPYLMPTIDRLIGFIKNNAHLKFRILFIGGGCAKEESRLLKRIFAKLNNVVVEITGYIYPIPLKLLQLPDVYISSSGSALLSDKFGIPTISIDGNDYMPIGILGVTTHNALFRDSTDLKSDLSELLHDILIDKKVQKKLVLPPEYCSSADFLSHFEFVAFSSKERVYYDVNRIRLKGVKSLVVRGFRIIGFQKFYRLLDNNLLREVILNMKFNKIV